MRLKEGGSTATEAARLDAAKGRPTLMLMNGADVMLMEGMLHDDAWRKYWLRHRRLEQLARAALLPPPHSFPFAVKN